MSQLSFTDGANLIEPAGGISVWALGVLVTLKALGNETGGGYAMFEATVPPGAGPPPHKHSREVETFYMLEGELTWSHGDKSLRATEGCFIHLPTGEFHSFINESDKPARMLVTYIPGGFDHWFLQIGAPVADRYAPGDPPQLTEGGLTHALALASEYGIAFVDPREPKDEL